MKLVFVIHDREKFLSGPIINIKRIVPYLVNAGYEIYVLSFFTDGHPNADELESGGIVVFRYSITNSLDDQVLWTLQVMEQIQPDILFSDVSNAAGLAGKWLRQAGIAVINHHRSDDSYNWDKAHIFSDNNSEFQSSGFICVSQFLLDQLRERYDPHIPMWVIPSGVPISPFVATHANEDFKIVYAGRLFEKQKRISDTIARFIRLCSEDSEITVSIIGDGPEKLQCEKMVADAGLVGRINFLGNLSGGDYHEKLSEHNVLVLLSDYEGTPGSVMDAMSCGLVPVVLRYNGVEELIRNGENGFVVENRYESFYDAIDGLRHNREILKEKGSRARNHIIGQYSIERTVESLIRVIEGFRDDPDKKPFIAPKEVKIPEYFIRKTGKRKSAINSLIKQIFAFRK